MTNEETKFYHLQITGLSKTRDQSKPYQEVFNFERDKIRRKSLNRVMNRQISYAFKKGATDILIDIGEDEELGVRA